MVSNIKQSTLLITNGFFCVRVRLKKIVLHANETQTVIAKVTSFTQLQRGHKKLHCLLSYDFFMLMLHSVIWGSHL